MHIVINEKKLNLTKRNNLAGINQFWNRILLQSYSISLLSFSFTSSYEILFVKKRHKGKTQTSILAFYFICEVLVSQYIKF